MNTNLNTLNTGNSNSNIIYHSFGTNEKFRKVNKVKDDTPGPGSYHPHTEQIICNEEKFKFQIKKNERKIHDDPKTNIAPGYYRFHPIITNEGERYSMRSSKPTTPSSNTWFVPGPKYSVGDSHRNKPPLFK